MSCFMTSACRENTMNSSLSRSSGCRGQHLIEFVLTFPLIIVLLFAIIDFSRALHAYNATRLAASEGAFVAAANHNATTGRVAMINRLTAAGIPGSGFMREIQSANVTTVYEATAIVNFVPMWGGLSIPTIGGPIQIIPPTFPIVAEQSQYASVY